VDIFSVAFRDLWFAFFRLSCIKCGWAS